MPFPSIKENMSLICCATILVEEGAYAPGVAAPNWFDADHVSTEIPEHHPGQLTANVGEVEHSIGGK